MRQQWSRFVVSVAQTEGVESPSMTWRALRPLNDDYVLASGAAELHEQMSNTGGRGEASTA
jgi:hypothetical protein